MTEKDKSAGIPARELVIPSGLPEDFVQTPDGGLSVKEAARRLASGLGNQQT
jgi:hypothetical protein